MLRQKTSCFTKSSTLRGSADSLTPAMWTNREIVYGMFVFATVCQHTVFSLFSTSCFSFPFFSPPVVSAKFFPLVNTPYLCYYY